MPDIAMCRNDNCPMAKTCYRHEAVPSSRQAYADFKPTSDQGCEHFEPIWPNPRDSEV